MDLATMTTRISLDLTPAQIVTELDRYIVVRKGQAGRRDRAPQPLARRRASRPSSRRVAPKNIIMIGPTGVGKDEVARPPGEAVASGRS